MRFSAWLRRFWWAGLVGILAYTLRGRWEAIMSGTSQPFDIVLALILFALLLGPLFPELTLFGVTLKQYTEGMKKELQGEIKSQFSDLRQHLENVITNNNRIYQGVYLAQPPSDAALKELKEEIKAGLDKIITKGGLPAPAEDLEHLRPPEEAIMAFTSRYQIEQELRRIWHSHGLGSRPGYGLSPSRMLQDLSRAEILPQELRASVAEVLRVCSPIVHGVEPSSEQTDFIRSVTPVILAALKAVA